MIEYATYDGVRVQVLERYRKPADCRACGGDGYLPPEDDGVNTPARDCPYCVDGKQYPATEWAKVGFLEGPMAGWTGEIRASGLQAEVPA